MLKTTLQNKLLAGKRKSFLNWLGPAVDYNHTIPAKVIFTNRVLQLNYYVFYLLWISRKQAACFSLFLLLSNCCKHDEERNSSSTSFIAIMLNMTLSGAPSCYCESVLRTYLNGHRLLKHLFMLRVVTIFNIYNSTQKLSNVHSHIVIGLIVTKLAIAPSFTREKCFLDFIKY